MSATGRSINIRPRGRPSICSKCHAAATSLTVSQEDRLAACASADAARASRQAPGEGDDHSPAQGCDRIGDVAFGPDRRHLWVGDRREAQASGCFDSDRRLLARRQAMAPGRPSKRPAARRKKRRPAAEGRSRRCSRRRRSLTSRRRRQRSPIRRSRRRSRRCRRRSRRPAACRTLIERRRRTCTETPGPRWCCAAAGCSSEAGCCGRHHSSGQDQDWHG